MAQQSRLGLLDFERLAQQRILLQIQHPQAKVEAGAPVGVDLVQLIGAERSSHNCRASSTVRRNLFVSVNRLGSFRERFHSCVPLFWITDPGPEWPLLIRSLFSPSP